MKKTIIALAVLGATAGVAHAQSNVTVYGIVDTGYVKETGSKVTMDEKVNNRLGFRGVEDLGGGMKATFELEHRFKLPTGKSSSRGDFEGAANVGLAGNFGAVRFGRVNELSTETLRTLDPFNQYGVGGMIETPLRGHDTEGRLSYTARYDSPNMSGFSFGASYSLKNNPNTVGLVTAGGGEGTFDNDGYALSVKYMNGPIVALANYNRAVNSNDSYNWNVGGAYSFGPAKLSLAYEKTELQTAPIVGEDVGIKNILAGLSYKIGSGTINASFNRAKADVAGADGTAKKFALGYTHDLSKRTSVYLDVARTKLDSDYIDFEGNDKINAVNVGVTHKF